MRCSHFTAWHGFSLVEGISTLFSSHLARQFAVDLHLSSTLPNLTPFLPNLIFRFKTLAAVLWPLLPFTLEGDRWWVARTFDSGPLQQELHWPSCKPLSYFLSCPLDRSLVLLRDLVEPTWWQVRSTPRAWNLLWAPVFGLLSLFSFMSHTFSFYMHPAPQHLVVSGRQKFPIPQMSMWCHLCSHLHWYWMDGSPHFSNW